MYRRIEIINSGIVSILFIVMVLSPNLASPVVGLLLILSLYSLFKFKGTLKLRSGISIQHISLVGLFVLYVFGLFYSSNTDFGFKEIEARLSFIIFPVIFMIFNLKQLKFNFNMIALSFTLACLISSILSIIQGYNCIGTIDERYYDCFSGSLLSYKLHINYISIYYFTAVLMLWFTFKNSLFWIILKTVVSVWLFYFIFLFESLGSWVAIVVTLLSLVIYRVFKLKRTKIWLFSLIGSIVIGSILSYFIYTEINKSYQENYKHINSKEELYQVADNTRESVLARLVVWDIAVNEILKHPFGVGTGDVKDHLISKYRENNLNVLAGVKLNPHNQFLQTGVAIGWLGIIVLVVLHVGIIVKGIKKNNLILVAFTVLCFINMMFESFLERQAGIIFFSVMIFLIDTAFSKTPKKMPFSIPKTNQKI